MLRSYPGDPYWLMSRYSGRCSGCGVPFAKGSRIFHYKNGSNYGDECGCGDACEQDFISLAQDEDMLNYGHF